MTLFGDSYKQKKFLYIAITGRVVADNYLETRRSTEYFAFHAFPSYLIRFDTSGIKKSGKVFYLTSHAVSHIATAAFARQIANMTGQILRETPAVPKTLAAN